MKNCFRCKYFKKPNLFERIFYMKPMGKCKKLNHVLESGFAMEYHSKECGE
jgi:hypothetical protein